MSVVIEASEQALVKIAAAIQIAAKEAGGRIHKVVFPNNVADGGSERLAGEPGATVEVPTDEEWERIKWADDSDKQKLFGPSPTQVNADEPDESPLANFRDVIIDPNPPPNI